MSRSLTMVSPDALAAVPSDVAVAVEVTDAMVTTPPARLTCFTTLRAVASAVAGPVSLAALSVSVLPELVLGAGPSAPAMVAAASTSPGLAVAVTAAPGAGVGATGGGSGPLRG